MLLRFILAALIVLASAPAMAQGINNPGPCTAFGTIAGTCLQGAGALGTPSSGVATNLTGLPLTTGVTGNLSPSNGGKPANRFTSFTNTTTTTNASGTATMGGFGATWALTPATTGSVRVRVTGTTENNNAGGGSAFFVKYGTGTAPTAGAANTGTVCTTSEYTAGLGAITFPYATECELTGLTLSTAYWFDISLRALSAGTATNRPISVVIEEF